MSNMLAELKQRAARSSEAERAELALELIESLDAETDVDAAEAWCTEVECRVGEIERGELQLIPGDEVLARLRRELG